CRPGLHTGGDGPVHRGVVAAGGGDRDDQLLPVLGADATEEVRGGDPDDQGAHPGHLGATRPLPRRGPGRAGTRRRPQPGSRRAPGRRVALGAPRRRRARQRVAHRLLRAREDRRTSLVVSVGADPTPSGAVSIDGTPTYLATSDPDRTVTDFASKTTAA